MHRHNDAQSRPRPCAGAPPTRKRWHARRRTEWTPRSGCLCPEGQKQGVKSFEQCTIAEARAVIDTFPQLQNPPEGVQSVEDIDLDGVAMRVYTPATA